MKKRHTPLFIWQHHARARVSQENTREQPDHRSTTRANHNTGLSHARDGRGRLTSFARPLHDLPHTFPRQLALAARWRVCLSRPLPSKSTQIQNDLWSWYHSRSTVQYLVAVHSMSDGSLTRHSWNPSLVEFPRVTDKWAKIARHSGKFPRVTDFRE